ncbi:host attachment protein [Inmirania thermothiophila]|uniref:Protein required for attachment to host cells n=1 Tax=Inmirania thermothiophila TaxID=1750597 RepID=A0A3N1YB57_9GAMM|nr:host attachment protein [Inmirania thermothiophila]ROR34627.1 protein required for attachment to host cells [Inmirania thermothiophila]
MTRYCVIVAGQGCARFFELRPAEHPELESGPNLVETASLTNEDASGEVWSDPKSGRNRAPGGGGAHGYDDHREGHMAEFERRFARRIGETAARMLRRHPARLVLVAEKRMLGHLRQSLNGSAAGVTVQEVAKDLCRMAPMEIHERLAEDGLLPRRRPPAA